MAVMAVMGRSVGVVALMAGPSDGPLPAQAR